MFYVIVRHETFRFETFTYFIKLIKMVQLYYCQSNFSRLDLYIFIDINQQKYYLIVLPKNIYIILGIISRKTVYLTRRRRTCGVQHAQRLSLVPRHPDTHRRSPARPPRLPYAVQ